MSTAAVVGALVAFRLADSELVAVCTSMVVGVFTVSLFAWSAHRPGPDPAADDVLWSAPVHGAWLCPGADPAAVSGLLAWTASGFELVADDADDAVGAPGVLHAAAVRCGGDLVVLSTTAGDVVLRAAAPGLPPDRLRPDGGWEPLTEEEAGRWWARTAVGVP